MAESVNNTFGLNLPMGRNERNHFKLFYLESFNIIWDFLDTFGNHSIIENLTNHFHMSLDGLIQILLNKSYSDDTLESDDETLTSSLENSLKKFIYSLKNSNNDVPSNENVKHMLNEIILTADINMEINSNYFNNIKKKIHNAHLAALRDCNLFISAGLKDIYLKKWEFSPKTDLQQFLLEIKKFLINYESFLSIYLVRAKKQKFLLLETFINVLINNESKHLILHEHLEENHYDTINRTDNFRMYMKTTLNMWWNLIFNKKSYKNFAATIPTQQFTIVKKKGNTLNERTNIKTNYIKYNEKLWQKKYNCTIPKQKESILIYINNETTDFPSFDEYKEALIYLKSLFPGEEIPYTYVFYSNNLFFKLFLKLTLILKTIFNFYRTTTLVNTNCFKTRQEYVYGEHVKLMGKNICKVMLNDFRLRHSIHPAKQFENLAGLIKFAIQWFNRKIRINLETLSYISYKFEKDWWLNKNWAIPSIDYLESILSFRKEDLMYYTQEHFEVLTYLDFMYHNITNMLVDIQKLLGCSKGVENYWLLFIVLNFMIYEIRSVMNMIVMCMKTSIKTSAYKLLIKSKIYPIHSNNGGVWNLTSDFVEVLIEDIFKKEDYDSDITDEDYEMSESNSKDEEETEEKSDSDFDEHDLM